MRQILGGASAPLLTQALFAIASLCIWTIVGMFVMKFFVRKVPLLDHAAILFWATLRVQIVVLALIFVLNTLGISMRPLSGFVSLLALCAIGWLVTQDLSRRYSVPTEFPAVGAKVMATMTIISLLIVISIIAMTGA
jgi:hypothetical protein